MNTNIGCKKLKVCHVLDRLEVGGMENGVVNICNNLNRAKFIPVILAVKALGPMKERLNADVEIFCLQSGNGKNFFRYLKMAAFFKEMKPDIVHTHGWGACSFDGIIGAKLAKVPIVINGEHGSFFLKWHQIFLQKILALMCDRILSVSESLKARVGRTLDINTKKIKTVLNGVDTNKFNPKNTTVAIAEELKEKFDFIKEDGDFILISVGSLKKNKNQQLLLDALANLKRNKDISRMKVFFAGDGEDKMFLQEYAEEKEISKNVFFLGQRKDIAELLCLSDVLVSTSIAGHEGLSNVLLEAMSSSLPVISTGSVGTTEVIKDGKNGFIVREDDFSLLSEKINFFVDNKTSIKSMGNYARQFVEENYSIKKMIEGYEAVYFSLYNKSKKL